MKKFSLLLAGFVVAGLVSCGPSADDAKKLEEAMNAAQDSMTKALEAAAANAAAPADSAAAAPADSAAHAH